MNAMFKVSKQASKFLVKPIIYIILLNTLIAFLFLNSLQQMFELFFNDFGLTGNGNWNLIILNLQHTLSNGTIATYPYINYPFLIFLICIIGNTLVSAKYIMAAYRNGEEKQT
jgi:hypothetical protein